MADSEGLWLSSVIQAMEFASNRPRRRSRRLMTPTRSWEEFFHAMSRHLLNQNQRRRVDTHLGLLREDLGNLRRWASPLAATPAGRRIGDAIRLLEGEIDAVRRRFDLHDTEPPPLKRRVGAIAEVWRARMHDLRARHLESYGTVHPDLAAALDPCIDRLESLLRDLAQAALQLPETTS
jgi:hypothetical protein